MVDHGVTPHISHRHLHLLLLHPSLQENERDFSPLIAECSKMYWFNLKAQQIVTGPWLQRDFWSFLYQLITFKQILTVELIGKCQLLFLSFGLTMLILAAFA